MQSMNASRGWSINGYDQIHSNLFRNNSFKDNLSIEKEFADDLEMNDNAGTCARPFKLPFPQSFNANNRDDISMDTRKKRPVKKNRPSGGVDNSYADALTKDE